MHANMKYYVVSMGGIFVSLGIGILIGFNLNYDQELSKQQSEIIKDLDVRFDELKTTNDNLEIKLKELNSEYDKTIAFMNNNLDKLIIDELKGQSIGIISTNSSVKVNHISDAITKANGNIAFSINFTNKINDENILKQLSENLKVEIKDSNQLALYVLEALQNNEAESKLKILKDLELIDSVSLSSDYKNCDSVILNGDGNSDEVENIFKDLNKTIIEKLKSNGKYLVGTDIVDSKLPYIDLYSDSAIPTINNIDEQAGKLSLVILLKDKNISGNFGTGEEVDSLIPNIKNK